MVSQRRHRRGAGLAPLLLVGGVIRRHRPLVGGRRVVIARLGMAKERGQVERAPGIESAAARGNVLPDEHAKTVGEVVQAVRLHLHVLAHHVEAEVPRRQEVGSHGLVRGRGEKTVRPVALVEKATQEERPVVEHETRRPDGVALDGYGAEGAVAAHAVLAIGDLEGIEVGVVGLPEPRVGNGDRHLSVVSESRRPASNGDAESLTACGDPCPHRQGLGVGIGIKYELLDVGVRNLLEPDGLPDSRLGGVPHGAARELLLAAKLRARLARVPDADRELVLAFAERLADVENKRQVAAPVLADLLAVEIDGAGEVHAIEVEQHASSRGGRRSLEAASVPEQLARLELPLDPRELRLGREGHDDSAVPPGGERRVPPVGPLDEGVVPPAVERPP